MWAEAGGPGARPARRSHGRTGCPRSLPTCAGHGRRLKESRFARPWPEPEEGLEASALLPQSPSSLPRGTWGSPWRLLRGWSRGPRYGGVARTWLWPCPCAASTGKGMRGGWGRWGRGDLSNIRLTGGGGQGRTGAVTAGGLSSTHDPRRAGRRGHCHWNQPARRTDMHCRGEVRPVATTER